MTTTFDLARVAAAVANPTQQWAAAGQPLTSVTLPRVSIAPKVFDDPTYLAQNPPKEVFAADPLI
jgi:hypothetical protein